LEFILSSKNILIIATIGTAKTIQIIQNKFAQIIKETSVANGDIDKVLLII
jgi:hypothetical protein